MCGIAGHIRLDDQAPRLDIDVAQRALQSLSHRGPDGSGEWRAEDGSCWLGHRRLAIIDLETGQQPMSDESKAIWVTFNGEIYNFQALRHELANLGHRFRTHSDTEVLVHGYLAWGATGLAQRLQGIFAFAVYDRRTSTLLLCRDHMGVKPLYWWSNGKTLIFASEIKTLLCFREIRESKKVYRPGVAQYIVTRYVSRPNTMFQDIQKLPEGCLIEFSRGSGIPAPSRYWDVRYEPRVNPDTQTLEELDVLLRRTVNMQLMSDVPLGVQLSGGVDSSMVVALMETMRRENGASEPIKTFAVGFDIPEFSELHHARQIAERYGTEHHEIIVGADDFVADFPRLCWLYDEPMGEPPAIPTYYMCQAAKKHVTVMLTGEGADEQFGGYSKYVFDSFSGMLDWLPDGARQAALRGAGAAMPFKARRLRSILEILGIGPEPQRFASWFGGFDSVLQQQLLHPDFLNDVNDGGLSHEFSRIMAGCNDKDDALNRFLYCDIHSRLVDDILVKGDRMSMAAGIESRVPFLDHRVVEFAANLPSNQKVSGLQKKIILKKLAERYLPHQTIYRRKVGFTVPLARWFTGPLAGLISHVLLSERFFDRGYFRPDVVKNIVREHIGRKVDREQGIWLLLTLELWHRIFVDDDGSEAASERLSAELAPYLQR
jgi:asparagine synthase (glutamine-hydrolysing)